MSRRTHHSKAELSENFRRFWALRGGPDAFERWRLTGKYPELWVRVTGPGFVAGFSITDVVRSPAPILVARGLKEGLSESRARELIEKKGWRASVIRVVPN